MTGAGELLPGLSTEPNPHGVVQIMTSEIVNQQGGTTPIRVINLCNS
jgi:hypothetical protein